MASRPTAFARPVLLGGAFIAAIANVALAMGGPDAGVLQRVSFLLVTLSGICALAMLADQEIRRHRRARKHLDEVQVQLDQEQTRFADSISYAEQERNTLIELYKSFSDRVAILSVHRSGRILGFSDGARLLIGDGVSEILGKRIDDVIEVDGKACSIDSLMQYDGAADIASLKLSNVKPLVMAVSWSSLDGLPEAEEVAKIILHDATALAEERARWRCVQDAILSLKTPLEIYGDSGETLVTSAGIEVVPADQLVVAKHTDASSTEDFDLERGDGVVLYHERRQPTPLERLLMTEPPRRRQLWFDEEGHCSYGTSEAMASPFRAAIGRSLDQCVSDWALAEQTLQNLGSSEPRAFCIANDDKSHMFAFEPWADGWSLTVFSDDEINLRSITKELDQSVSWICFSNEGKVAGVSKGALELLGEVGSAAEDELAHAYTSHIQASIDAQKTPCAFDIEIGNKALSLREISREHRTFVIIDQTQARDDVDSLTQALNEAELRAPSEVRIDPYGQIVSVTASGARLLTTEDQLSSGFASSAEELIGASILDVLCTPAARAIEAGDEVVTTSGRSFRLVRIGRIDGTETIRIEDISPFILIKRISEIQRKADISATISLDGVILSVTDAYVDLLGKSREELIGQPLRDIFDDMFVRTGGYDEYWESVLKDKPGSARLERHHADGQKIYVAAQHTPIKGNDGEMACILEVLTDISVFQEERRDSQMQQRELMSEQRGILENLGSALRSLAEGNYEITLPDDLPFEYQALKEDFDLAVNSLADARVHRRRMKEQQEFVVRSLAQALENLSNGALTTTIQDSFPEEYEALRIDFNDAVERLNIVMAIITNTSKSVDEVSANIIKSTSALSHRTERQAVTLEETVQSVTELTAHVQSTARRAEEASSNASVVRADAESSMAIVQNAVHAMAQIEKSSVRVSAILSVIDDIAFQTNLLALNAGVEAARAGDSGRGFAVVAQEVRSLAQRSAESAKQIGELIKTSTEQVSEGVSLVNEAGGSIGSILEKVQSVSEEINAIAESATTQARGIEELNNAVSDVDKVTKKNLVMAEENTEVGISLGQAAGELLQQVAHFKVDSDQVRESHRPKAEFRQARAHTGAKKPTAFRIDGSAALSEDWSEF